MVVSRSNKLNATKQKSKYKVDFNSKYFGENPGIYQNFIAHVLCTADLTL